MKERPILFNTEMVKAILAGTKTQTRRIIKIQPPNAEYRISTLAETTDRSRKKLEGQHHWVIYDHDKHSIKEDQDKYFRSPFGYVGDRLWVREAHTFRVQHYCGESGCDCDDISIRYEADNSSDMISGAHKDIPDNWGFEGGRLRPSLHMPRWASRITLEITNVRVERLQDISEDDAKAEGVDIFRVQLGELNPILVPGGHRGTDCPKEGFNSLWDSINGANSWSENPWVWVVEFKRVNKC